MYIIQSTKDNSYYYGPDTIAGVVAESYGWMIEDAKTFASMDEAREVQAGLLDKNTIVIPYNKISQVNYFDALDGL